MDLSTFRARGRRLNGNGLWLDKVIDMKASRGLLPQTAFLGPQGPTALHLQLNPHITTSPFSPPTMDVPMMQSPLTSGLSIQLPLRNAQTSTRPAPDPNSIRSLNVMSNTFVEPEDRFHKFSEFPKEIRLMIWKAALPGPRVVEVRVKELKKQTPAYDEITRPAPLELEEEDVARWGFRPMCQIPSILLACQESHEVSSKFYKRALATFFSVPQTYLDFERDTVYIQWGEFFKDVFSHSPGFRDLHTVDIIKNIVCFPGARGDDFIESQSMGIKNLAILFDKQYQSHAGQALRSQEAQFSFLILALFPETKNIAICVDHYSASSPQPKNWRAKFVFDNYTDTSPISFIEPISLTSLYNTYWSNTLAPISLKHAIPLPAGNRELARHGYFSHGVFENELKAVLRTAGRVTKTEVPMPKIEWKVAVTEAVKESPEALMRGLDERWRLTPTVHPGNYLPGSGLEETYKDIYMPGIFEKIRWRDYIELSSVKYRLEEAKRRLKELNEGGDGENSDGTDGEDDDVDSDSDSDSDSGTDGDDDDDGSSMEWVHTV